MAKKNKAQTRQKAQQKRREKTLKRKARLQETAPPPPPPTPPPSARRRAQNPLDEFHAFIEQMINDTEDEYYEDEYSDDEYSDDEYSEDEYSDDEYSEDEYSDDGYWSDDGVPPWERRTHDVLPPPPSPDTIVPPALERCHPPIWLDPAGRPVDNPWQVLDLDPASTPHERAIRAAYTKKLLLHPPERHPDMARRLREARDLLLDPQRYIQRMLGEVHVPDPVAWGLRDNNARQAHLLPAADRIMGELALYALLEEILDQEDISCGTAQVPIPF